MVRDVELVTRAQQGDERATEELIRRYDGAAHQIAGVFFHPSLEHDDLHQEALLGIVNAIRNYDPAAETPFQHFANLCIRRAVITAVKTAGRDKHKSLTYATRVVASGHDDGEPMEAIMLAVAPGELGDRQDWREEVDELSRKLRVELSPRELNCLLWFANGLTYEDIAAREKISTKNVDTAIQRARWKLTGIGPPSQREHFGPRNRKQYVCPGCGHATVKRVKGRGRPPKCNVCLFRAQAA